MGVLTAARPFKWKPVITRQRRDVSFLSAMAEGLQIIVSRRLSRYRVGVRVAPYLLSKRYANVGRDGLVYLTILKRIPRMPFYSREYTFLILIPISAPD